VEEDEHFFAVCRHMMVKMRPEPISWLKSIFLRDWFQTQPKSRFARAASNPFKFASVSAIFGFPKSPWI